MKYITTIGERSFEVEVLDEKHVRLDGQIFRVDFETINDDLVYSLILDGESHEAFVYPGEDTWQVLLRGRLFPARVEDEREKRLRESSGSRAADFAEFQLKAPMPGLVVSVLVAEGQEVKKGDVLVILESMKMQNELKSPRDGVISRVRVETGDHIEQRQVLLNVV